MMSHTLIRTIRFSPVVVVRLTLLSVSVENMTGEDLRKDFSPWILVVILYIYLKSFKLTTTK